MKTLGAILLGKFILSFSRFLKVGGGSAAPGLYALKIDPDLISKLAKKIPQNIVITGTNGKTTTARLLSHFAKEAGLKIIRNNTGSNLERGVASSLINHSSFFTPNSYDLGIWELDEAAFNSVATKLNPNIVVFLNVFRDQLDRYGEVDTVVNRWCETLGKLPPKTVVLVNGDDTNTLKLKGCFKGQALTFGVEGFKIVGESLEEPPNHKLDFEAKNIKLNGLSGSKFSLILNQKSYILNLPIPGIYHIYDAVAALSCASLFFTDTLIRRLVDTLHTFQPAFGRVEKLPFGYILLIKNPAGAIQVFQTIASQMKKDDRLFLALNDNLADGTDVSWIWDVDLESTLNPSRVKSRDFNIICSGTRAEDLALRLKYAGFDPKVITIENDLKRALEVSRRGLKGQLYILPTYTALLELQRILTKVGVKKHYWEEA